MEDFVGFYVQHQHAFGDAYPSAYAIHSDSSYYWIAQGNVNGHLYEITFYCPYDDCEPDTYNWAECIVDINHI